MLNVCILSALMILCVFGIYFLTKEVTSFILKNNISSQVILEINDNANKVEDTVRNALYANPESDITVIDKSGSSEIKEILKKLSKDDCRIHIKGA